MVKSARPTTGHHRKRYGQHQTRSKPFLKTYLPYLPLIAIISVGIFIGSQGRPSHPAKSGNGVLAYATNVSATSLLTETNTERTSHGDTPLKLNNQLSQAAQAKANDMVARNYWSHVTPDGQQPWSFLDQAGYNYQKAGENLAYGFNSSKATVAGWMNSPSHRENLLDKDFDEVGFGFANGTNYQNVGESTVVVAMYGHSQDSSTAAAAATPDTTQAVRGDATAVPAFTNTHTYQIARIQIITDGKAPWSLWLLIALAFAGICYMVVKHSLSLRRFITKGERFVLHHPLFDVTLLALVALCIFVTRAEGYILSAAIRR